MIYRTIRDFNIVGYIYVQFTFCNERTEFTILYIYIMD